ncbi:MAG: hypothetical protein ACRDNW_05205, partial [Trebonia sp.]
PRRGSSGPPPRRASRRRRERQPGASRARPGIQVTGLRVAPGQFTGGFAVMPATPAEGDPASAPGGGRKPANATTKK